MRIKWLQLSDIHFNFKNYDSEELRKGFINLIGERSSSEPFSHLFLTGDVLFQNEKAHEDTVNFINCLVNKMGISWENVFVVPGNHDHDRSQTVDTVLSLCTPKKKPNQSMIDNLSDGIINNLLDAFSGYDDIYYTLFGQHYYNKPSQPHIVRKLPQDISIVQLNTAWLDTESRKNSKVFGGSRQLQKLLDADKAFTSNKINIAIGHHPLDIV